MIAYRLDLKEGNVIGDEYCIVKKIGTGSYGDVYLVNSRHGYCALKILRLFDVLPDNHDNMIKYFKQEYETAKMPGECFVHSLEYSEIKGNPCFTMEYCSNGDLVKFVGKNTALLPNLARDILIGLHDLHSGGKIHRDLKPENVLIRENRRAALTDFGVVGNKDPNKRLSRSIFRKKQKFGTPLYMAPEMNDLKGGGVTYLPTIDIWSFGVMMHELLTFGSFPFGNPQDEAELPEYHIKAKAEIWNRQYLCEFPYGREWLPIIERCLKADYQERYQNVIDIMKDVEPLAGTSSSCYQIDRPSRSASISRIVITQGMDLGKTYKLYDLLEGKGRMIRVGRNDKNDIVLKVDPDGDTYLSRYHLTIERSRDGHYWTVKDGQWMKELREWGSSTNGTYLNASPVTSEGQRLYTGDIITAGEYKLKIE
jgi:serine/threonine protein kinase